MSSYSELANTIIQQKGAGGRFSGLNTALDLQEAYKQARLKYQMDSQLKQQESTADAAKGISQAGLMSGVTPSVDLAMQQYNKATGANLATGSLPQSPITPVSSDLPSGQVQLYGKAGVAQAQKNQAEQDRLEQNYSNRLDKEFQSRGNMGALKTKVNQAGQLRALLDQGYNTSTKTYDIKPAQYTDLSIGLANLISPNGVSSDAKIEAIRQKTLSGDINAGIGYLSGVPQTATTAPNFQLLADSINREGITAESQLKRDMQQLIARYPTNLKKESQQRIANTVMGGGYSDLFKLSPAYNDESQKLKDLLGKLTAYTNTDTQNRNNSSNEQTNNLQSLKSKYGLS